MTGNMLMVFVLGVVGVTLAYGPGSYIPKSYYIIDPFGHQSAPVFFRSKRDIMSHPLFRVKRGGGYASSSSQASASANSGASSGSGNYGDYIPNFAHDPSAILGQVQNLLNSIPGAAGNGGAGSHSFASSSSSSSAGHGAGAGGSGQSYGGQDASHQGPVLFSRFGEAQGTGVHVSGQAQGEKGAFSSSSSSIDSNGKINYSVQSGKY